ncbi:hypothetical protein [Psychrobacter sp. I-STPA6b]|uniref:hypothetical protein n=1 Tax=Psychrobacter sp. I-STPA6b TaxID=2585718 RepID=UPI001D0C972A|nr:hypothetical protein [Psychrobacter sp. I-STPA6b]
MNIEKLIAAAKEIEQVRQAQADYSKKLQEFADLSRKQGGLNQQQRIEYEMLERAPRVFDYHTAIDALISALHEKG